MGHGAPGGVHLHGAGRVGVPEDSKLPGLPRPEGVQRVLAVAIAGGDPGEELMLGTATTGYLTSVFSFPTEDQKARPRRANKGDRSGKQS